ncbi:MAG: hypothetical protein U0Q16_26910 [Bryobacteraceae bacterium]
MDLLNLVARHGPVLLAAICFLEAVGFPIPAAIALIGAGALVHDGRLPAATFAAGVGGLLAGDLILYSVGRFSGWYFLGLLCRLSANPEACIFSAANKFYQKGRQALLFTKFIPGINTMAAPLAGSLHMHPAQFLAFDLGGATIYASSYFLAGYLFSNLLEDIVGAMSTAGETIQRVLIGAALAYVGYRAWMARRLRSEFLDIPRVAAQDAAQTFEDSPDQFLVLDVRSHGYYAESAMRIKGAARLEPNRLPETLHELPDSKRIYLYCT